LIVCAGNSERGRDFAARNADMMFTNIRADLSEVPGSTSALKDMAGSYKRDIRVFSNIAVENADHDAVENMIVGRGLVKPGISEETLRAARMRAAGGNGAKPIVGDPDQVVAEMKRLSECGISALAMGFANYLEHFPYFRDEVIPRLVHKGLRAG